MIYSSIDCSNRSKLILIESIIEKTLYFHKIISEDDNDFMFLLFGGVAAAGLLVGLLALMRAVMLKAKLRRVERFNENI